MFGLYFNELGIRSAGTGAFSGNSGKKGCGTRCMGCTGLLINHECSLEITCSKPIRVPSHIPFKSQVCLYLGGLLL